MSPKKYRLLTVGLSIALILVFYNFGETVLFHTKEILHHTGLYNKEAAFRRRVTQCDETVDSYTLLPRRDCEDLLLLVLVFSVVENSNARKAVREYWGNSSNDKKENANLWRIIFVVGLSLDNDNTAVEKENEKYHDILRWEFEDNQDVLKNILGFYWASCRCHSSYVLRARDDVFVNIKALITWLHTNSIDSNHVYTGALSTTADQNPDRNYSHKNFISLESYSEEHFPAFITGPVCLISTDVVDRILHYIPRVKVFPAVEAYIGVLVHKTGTRPLENKKFVMKRLESVQNSCELKETFILLAKIMEDHEKIFNAIENSETKCNRKNMRGEILSKKLDNNKPIHT